MKETIKSMRLYFFLVGGVTVAAHGVALGHIGTADLGVVITGAVAALFGAAFFYAAVTLKTAVEHARTKAIEVILYVNMGLNVLANVLAMATVKERHIAGIRIIITLAIGFYLLVNLKRLVKEHATAVPELIPTPPPPIPAGQSPPEDECEGREGDGN